MFRTDAAALDVNCSGSRGTFSGFTTPSRSAAASAALARQLVRGRLPEVPGRGGETALRPRAHRRARQPHPRGAGDRPHLPRPLQRPQTAARSPTSPKTASSNPRLRRPLRHRHGRRRDPSPRLRRHLLGERPRPAYGRRGGRENILNIVKQGSFVGVLAVGMTFVLLTAGIDLSVGSIMYVTAMTVGYLLGIPGLKGPFGVFAGLVVGLATGAAFGAVNAFCIVYLSIAPFLVTLATMVAGHGLVTAVTELFGIDYPTAFSRLRRGDGPRRSDPGHRLRAGCCCRPRRPYPNRLRPSALCGRQRHRGGTKGDQHETASCSRCTSSRGSAPPLAACC